MSSIADRLRKLVEANAPANPGMVNGDLLDLADLVEQLEKVPTTDTAQRVLHELADNDEYGWAEAIGLIKNLLRWREEMLEVLSMWDRVFVALGSPGEPGELTPVAALRAVLDLKDKATLTPAEEDALAAVRRTQTIKIRSRVRVTAQSAYTDYSGVVLGVQPNGYAVKITHGPGDQPVKETETFFTPNEIGLA